MNLYLSDYRKHGLTGAHGGTILRSPAPSQGVSGKVPGGLAAELDRPAVPLEVGASVDLSGDEPAPVPGRGGAFPWTYDEALAVARTIRRGNPPTRQQEALLEGLGIDSVRIYNDYRAAKAFSLVKGTINLKLCVLRKMGLR